MHCSINISCVIVNLLLSYGFRGDVVNHVQCTQVLPSCFLQDKDFLNAILLRAPARAEIPSRQSNGRDIPGYRGGTNCISNVEGKSLKLDVLC